MYDLRTIKTHKFNFGIMPYSLINLDSIALAFSDKEKIKYVIWLGILSKYAAVWNINGKTRIIRLNVVQMVSETEYSNFEMDLSGDGIKVWSSDSVTGERFLMINEYEKGAFKNAPYMQFKINWETPFQNMSSLILPP